MCVQLKAARLAEVLWEKRAADMAEVARATTDASQVTHKIVLGRNIVEDYKTVGVGQSAYFTGQLPPGGPEPCCIHYILSVCMFLLHRTVKVVFLPCFFRVERPALKLIPKHAFKSFIRTPLRQSQNSLS
jgi:hypothetical protein